MLEGKNLLDAIHTRAEQATIGQTATIDGTMGNLELALQHNLRVALVWVLGARLPRYLVQVTLLLLIVVMAIAPHMEVLIVATCIIFLWSLVYACASLLEVRLMLRLLKEQPAWRRNPDGCSSGVGTPR